MTSSVAPVIFACLVVQALASGVTQCYKCQNAGSLKDCTTIQHCLGFNQMCLLEEYKAEHGVIHYFAGCTYASRCPKDGKVKFSNATGPLQCTSCCTSDLCNINTCGLTGHNLPHQIPVVDKRYCFMCDGVRSIYECTETCKLKHGEKCFLEAYAEGEKSMKYYGGCTSQSPSSFPVQTGHKVCSTSCDKNLCNFGACSHQVNSYITSLTVQQKRWCYQCYDQKQAEKEECFHRVQCSSSSSRCATVARQENSLVTVDMDCEENLPCTGGNGTHNQVCGQCCDHDNCNRDLNCLSPPVTVSTVHSTDYTATAPPHSQPLQCYQCHDLRVDSHNQQERCYNTVTCSSFNSRCSSVYREENGIVTVDVNCEESLACPTNATSTQLCGTCCDSDRCNYNMDCRNVVN